MSLKTLEGWDPGNVYGVPYMWGTVGLTFNVDMVKARIPKADLTSLDILFKPENAAKLADCGISILESPGDVIPMVLAYLGLDPNTTNPADFDAVVKAFAPIRQHIRAFDASNFLNAIANKELCMINTWSGDYATAKARATESGIEINLAYYVPKTGSPVWMDMWCIPAAAKHVENAHKFINYMMEPEVIAKCTNDTHYANANLAANKFVDPAILADPSLYPDDEVKKRLWTPKSVSSEVEQARTRAWSTIKAGSPSFKKRSCAVITLLTTETERTGAAASAELCSRKSNSLSQNFVTNLENAFKLLGRPKCSTTRMNTCGNSTSWKGVNLN